MTSGSCFTSAGRVAMSVSCLTAERVALVAPAAAAVAAAFLASICASFRCAAAAAAAKAAFLPIASRDVDGVPWAGGFQPYDGSRRIPKVLGFRAGFDRIGRGEGLTSGLGAGSVTLFSASFCASTALLGELDRKSYGLDGSYALLRGRGVRDKLVGSGPGIRLFEIW